MSSVGTHKAARNFLYLDPSVTYLPRWSRLMVSFLVGVFLILQGKSAAMLQYLFTDGLLSLLLSVVVSTLSASLVIGLIHWITRILDAHHPWHSHLTRRAFLQYLCACLLPFGFATFFDLAIIHFFGSGIAQSGYLRFELWINALLILLFNAAYVLWFHLKTVTWADTDQPVGRKLALVGAELKVRDQDRWIQIAVSDIVLVVKGKASPKVYTADGKTYVASVRGSALDQLLDPSLFYPAKRNLYVHGSIIIESVITRQQRPKDRMTYHNVLRYGNSALGQHDVTLVKGSVRRFKDWYANFRRLD